MTEINLYTDYHSCHTIMLEHRHTSGKIHNSLKHRQLDKISDASWQRLMRIVVAHKWSMDPPGFGFDAFSSEDVLSSPPNETHEHPSFDAVRYLEYLRAENGDAR